jgi:hypothetical protein
MVTYTELQTMKPEVEKQVREIEKEFARFLEYYVDDNVVDVKAVCDIHLTIQRPLEFIELTLVVK